MKKKLFEVCCKIYDKAIKGDTMKRNLIRRQKLERRAVWGKQGARDRMTALRSQALQGSPQLQRAASLKAPPSQGGPTSYDTSR